MIINFCESEKIIMQSAQNKKLYEFALSSGQSIQSLEKALSSVLRLAIGDHLHFNFLLHNINWFSEPYINHISILQKALRIYRGLGKQSQKVVYNILTDGMWFSASWKKSSQSLINLIKTGADLKLLKQSIKENYPHKVTQLQMQQNYLMGLLHLYKNFEQLRFDILEIIILQLASFDTELCTEDLNLNQIFASDSDIKGARGKYTPTTQELKFDALISFLLGELSQMKIFQQLLLIFKNDLILIDNTKFVQFLIYYFAESSKKESKQFVAFLLCQIFEKIDKKSNRKTLLSFSQYLASYISRSVTLPASFISKTMSNLIKLANQALNKKLQRNDKKDKQAENLKEIPQSIQKQIENLNLSKNFQQNFDLLLLLQTVLWIWTTRPQSRQNNQKQIKMLLADCEKYVYYKYFIHPDLLRECQLVPQVQAQPYKSLEIIHKFNPPLLKRLNFYIGPLIKPYQKVQNIPIKFQFIKSQVKHEAVNYEGLPVKRFKSQKKESQETNQ